MTRRKLFVALSAICIAMGMALAGNAEVMAKESERIITTDDGVNVQTYTDLGMNENVKIDSDLQILTSDSTTEAVQLAMPTNLHWGDNWDMCWDGVPEAEGYYGIEVYKDGEYYWSTSWSGLIYEPVAVGFSDQLEESGTYKFRVKSEKDWDDEGLIDSEWAEFSEERTYVRPDMSLPTVDEIVWDENEVGMVHFKTVGGAGGYKVSLYVITEDGVWPLSSTWWVQDGYADVAGEERTERFREVSIGEGRYYVTVQALSGDVDKIANGAESEPSAIFSTIESAEIVGNIINSAMNNETASEALKDITNGVSGSVIGNAMQTDEDVLNQVAELEALYAEEKGIEVAAPIVSDEASKYVDSTKVNVVGAGLNAEENTIGLEIDVPEKKEYINDQHYKNSVQLDITLVNDGSAIHGDLTMPITITMPIPTGIDARYLVVLHYNADGVAEKINLRVNDDNTVTFTVNSLSTFALAEESFFTDVEETDWYYQCVIFVYERGLMTGKGNDKNGNAIFDPEKAIPREEFVQVLYSNSGKPSVSIENEFLDVKDEWYKNAILWANANDIANGKGGGIFGVGDNISRQDLALMLYKYAQIKGYDLTTEVGQIDKYADGTLVSSYARTAVDWAITQGIISGKGVAGQPISTFRIDPQGKATRAECAAMMRMLLTGNE